MLFLSLEHMQQKEGQREVHEHGGKEQLAGLTSQGCVYILAASSKLELLAVFTVGINAVSSSLLNWDPSSVNIFTREQPK